MRSHSFLRGPVCLIALVACLATPVDATTQKQMSGKELVAAADLIVVGRCTEAASRWHGRALVTEATVVIDEVLSGRAARTITVTVPGGIDRSRAVPIAVTVPGAPSLLPNESFLLFLDRLPDEAGYTVVGLSQGAFPLLRHAGQTMVSRTRGQVRDGLPLEQVKRWIADNSRTER